MPEGRIFIVEDEIVIVRGLEEALGKLGYTVCGFAFAAEEALPRIERAGPDLVLVDIFLRGRMDGIELARVLITRFQIPIIYITAYSNREVLERAKLTDPFGYIVKPFRERQLKVNIELALERASREKRRRAVMAEYLSVNKELERNIKDHAEDLWALLEKHQQMEREVAYYQRMTDDLRHELANLNSALRILTQHMEKTRDDVELEMSATIRVKILPILRQLETDPCLEKCRTELDMLKLHLHQLTSGLGRDDFWHSALSTTELRIASLIRKGCTSEEIAERLHVAVDTVKTHRKRIRRKLNLQQSSVSLSTFLRDQTEVAVAGRHGF